jgi:hypothetical protein
VALPDTTAVRDRFTNEEVGNMLLVITFSGQLPEWPS